MVVPVGDEDVAERVGDDPVGFSVLPKVLPMPTLPQMATTPPDGWEGRTRSTMSSTMVTLPSGPTVIWRALVEGARSGARVPGKVSTKAPAAEHRDAVAAVIAHVRPAVVGDRDATDRGHVPRAQLGPVSPNLRTKVPVGL